MAWNLRPNSINQWPNNTPEEWRDEWFDPVTAAGLNKLKDNLEFLKKPLAYSYGRSTPGTVITMEGTTQTLASGTLDNYYGGLIYMIIKTEAVKSVGASNGNIEFTMTYNGGPFPLINYPISLNRGGAFIAGITEVMYVFIDTQSVNTYQMHQFIGVVSPMPLLRSLIGASLSLPLTLPWTLKGSAPVGETLLARNARVEMREM